MLQAPGVCITAAVGCGTHQTFGPGQALRPARPCRAAVSGCGMRPRLFCPGCLAAYDTCHGPPG